MLRSLTEKVNEMRREQREQKEKNRRESEEMREEIRRQVLSPWVQIMTKGMLRLQRTPNS